MEGGGEVRLVFCFQLWKTRVAGNTFFGKTAAMLGGDKGRSSMQNLLLKPGGPAWLMSLGGGLSFRNFIVYNFILHAFRPAQFISQFSLISNIESFDPTLFQGLITLEDLVVQINK